METSLGRITLPTLVFLVFVSFLSSISYGANEVIATETINDTQDISVVTGGDFVSDFYDLWTQNTSDLKGILGGYQYSSVPACYRGYFEFRVNDSINLDKVLIDADVSINTKEGSIFFYNVTDVDTFSTSPADPFADIYMSICISPPFNATYNSTHNLSYELAPAVVSESTDCASPYPSDFISNISGTSLFNTFYNENSLYVTIKGINDDKKEGGVCAGPSSNSRLYDNFLSSNPPNITLQSIVGTYP